VWGLRGTQEAVAPSYTTPLFQFYITATDYHSLLDHPLPPVPLKKRCVVNHRPHFRQAKRYLVNELRCQPSYREQSLLLRKGASAATTTATTTPLPLPPPPGESAQAPVSSPADGSNHGNVGARGAPPPLSSTALNDTTGGNGNGGLAILSGGTTSRRRLAGSRPPPPLLPRRPGRTSPARTKLSVRA